MAELNYELVKVIGELGMKNVRGVNCTMKLVREKWNSYTCWAIRCFQPDGKYTKGQTLTTEQLTELKKLLAVIDIEKEEDA